MLLVCCCPQAASGYCPASEEYPDLPASVPAEARVDHDMRAAELEAQVVGRQFHRGSGDKPFVTAPTYPRFEGRTLEVRHYGLGPGSGGLASLEQR